MENDIKVLKKIERLLITYGANEQEVKNFMEDLIEMQDEPTDEQKIKPSIWYKEKLIMAWSSNKQYRIMMQSKEGKDLAAKLGDMEQDAFQGEFA